METVTPTTSFDGNLVSRLRKARGSQHNLLRKVIMAKSKPKKLPVLVVEGSDDVTFYMTMINKVRGDYELEYIVADGKKNVLGLRTLVNSNRTGDLSDVKFAVDRDFDELQGHTPGGDIYCTPTYSIENMLVCRRNLNNLLLAEFRCSRDDSADSILNLLTLYDERHREFCSVFHEANRMIFYARNSGVKLNGIEDKVNKYVNIKLHAVTSKVGSGEIATLVGYPEAPSDMELSKIDCDFQKLTPNVDWRGKFFIDFFRTILAQLKEDRCQKKPTYFEKKQTVSFEPGKDMFRMLSSMTNPPECMKDFIFSI